MACVLPFWQATVSQRCARRTPVLRVHRPSCDWPLTRGSGQKASMDGSRLHASRRPALLPAELTTGHWSQQACEQALSPPLPGGDGGTERPGHLPKGCAHTATGWAGTCAQGAVLQSVLGPSQGLPHLSLAAWSL